MTHTWYGPHDDTAHKKLFVMNIGNCYIIIIVSFNRGRQVWFRRRVSFHKTNLRHSARNSVYTLLQSIIDGRWTAKDMGVIYPIAVICTRCIFYFIKGITLYDFFWYITLRGWWEQIDYRSTSCVVLRSYTIRIYADIIMNNIIISRTYSGCCRVCYDIICARKRPVLYSTFMTSWCVYTLEPMVIAIII